MSASTPSSTLEPSSHQRRHLSRKTQARWQLIGVLLILVVAFGLLFSFAFSERNHWRAMIGLLFGGAVTACLLLGMIWQRQNWARYVLIGALVAIAGSAGICLLFLLSNPEDAHGPHVPCISAGIFCLLGAAGWLMFSRRISYLTTPPGSGG